MPKVNAIRKLVAVQALLITITAVVFFILNGAFLAGSAVFGGSIACASTLLLEWRRRGADAGPALSAAASMRVLTRTALERFVLVVTGFVLGMGVWELDPLALLTGFIAGQVANLYTQVDQGKN